MVNNTESRQLKCHGGLGTAATNGFRTLQPFVTATKRTSCVIRTLAHDGWSELKVGTAASNGFRTPFQPFAIVTKRPSCAIRTLGQQRMVREDNVLQDPRHRWQLSEHSASTAPKRTSCVARILAHRWMVRAGNDLRSPARPSSSMAVSRTFSSCSDVNDERHAKPDPDIDLQ
jgi:hypothetical protein